tara:strand:+ start:41 stop:301 length:261 start_codon:yes stop_codon:yes gene_type:complete
MRITKNVLEELVSDLNYLLFPNANLLKEIGWFVLDSNNDGYKLARIVNSQGGERDLTYRENGKEIYAYVSGLINGIKIAQAEIINV